MSRALYASVALLLLATSAHAQTFDSGSDGSDGPLFLTTPGIVDFNPAVLFPHHVGNVYRFQAITIGRGVTVRLNTLAGGSAAAWLSQGPVLIEGTLDLTGADSVAYAAGGKRTPVRGGPGGYPGGVGASKYAEAQPGEGTSPGAPNHGGAFSGNIFLVPLTGGSGGGGTDAASGGGGGGALLIASSSSITVNGIINANGGNQNAAEFATTGGGGGAVRLAAPRIDGTGGTITARGGKASGGDFSGSDGRIRIEAFENELTADLNGTPVSVGKPFRPFPPDEAGPSARILSMGGVSVADSPEGSHVPPISAPGPVKIEIEGRRMKPGMVVRLRVYSETGPDQSVLVPMSPETDLSRGIAEIQAPSANAVLVVSVELKEQPRAFTARH